MLNKIGGLARAIYVILAIVAGFVALGSMNLPLILVVLGLIAGLAMPRTSWSWRWLPSWRCPSWERHWRRSR